MTGSLALVLAGGGARAAYQVGVLRALARRFPTAQFSILTGVSAGAINSAFLANHQGTFEQAVAALYALWADISTEKVLHADFIRLLGRAFAWAAHLAVGGLGNTRETRGMVDTAPLRQLLVNALCAGEEATGLPGIERNLAVGKLRSLALTTTDYASGQAITWVQGQDLEWKRGVRQSRQCRLSVDHVMASASIPLFFPAVRLGNNWHGDGGVRQTAPLSPALHLGADRILAISPRRSRGELASVNGALASYPPPAQIMGIMMNAVFLDMLDHDVEVMRRLNQLIAELAPEKRHGLRPVDLVVIRPSTDLGKIAGEYEHCLPRTYRYLLRGWGTKQSRASDSIAMLLFEAEYTQRLMALGEEDGEAHANDVARLLQG